MPRLADVNVFDPLDPSGKQTYKVYINPQVVAFVGEAVEGTGDEARLVTYIHFTNDLEVLRTLTPARDVAAALATY